MISSLEHMMKHKWYSVVVYALLMCLLAGMIHFQLNGSAKEGTVPTTKTSNTAQQEIVSFINLSRFIDVQ